MSGLPGDVVLAKTLGSFYTCMEEHSQDVPAVYAVVTEADSFGCEYGFFCEPCYDQYKADLKKAKEAEEANPTGNCYWCNASNVVVYPHRDFEEGSFGRVYDVCRPCIDKEIESIREELDYDDFDDY